MCQYYSQANHFPFIYDTLRSCSLILIAKMLTWKFFLMDGLVKSSSEFPQSSATVMFLKHKEWEIDHI